MFFNDFVLFSEFLIVFKKIFFIFKRNATITRIVAFLCLQQVFFCDSRVQILSVGEKSILDLWKSKKSDRRKKKRRNLSKSPRFSFYLGRI